MGALVGMGDPARPLRRVLRRRAEEAENRYRIVAGLHLHHRKVYGPGIEPRRRAGLEPPLRKLELLEPGAERTCRRVAGATTRVIAETNVDQPVEEGTGGKHHGGRLEAHAQLGDHPGDPLAGDGDVVHRRLEERQPGLVLEPPADRRLVHHPVGLGPRGPHRRTLGGIENAELDAALVGRRGHRAAQGVDFLDQVPLPMPRSRDCSSLRRGSRYCGSAAGSGSPCAQQPARPRFRHGRRQQR